MDTKTFQLKLPSNTIQVQVEINKELLQDAVNGSQYIKRNAEIAFINAIENLFDKIEEIPNSEFKG